MLNEFIKIRKKLTNVDILSPNEILGIMSPDAEDIETIKLLVTNQCMDKFVYSPAKKALFFNEIKIDEQIKVKLFPQYTRSD